MKPNLNISLFRPHGNSDPSTDTCKIYKDMCYSQQSYFFVFLYTLQRANSLTLSWHNKYWHKQQILGEQINNPRVTGSTSYFSFVWNLHWKSTNLVGRYKPVLKLPNICTWNKRKGYIRKHAGRIFSGFRRQRILLSCM